MRSPTMENFPILNLLSVITIIPAVMLATLFLFLGAFALIWPDVPEEALTENAFVGGILILNAAALIFALFRPYSGGFFVFFCAVPFAFIFNAFHLSKTLYPSRAVGYAPFYSVITSLIIVLGVLSVVRGSLSRAAASEDAD